MGCLDLAEVNLEQGRPNGRVSLRKEPHNITQEKQATAIFESIPDCFAPEEERHLSFHKKNKVQNTEGDEYSRETACNESSRLGPLGRLQGS
jgi:hypothetical protein